LALLSVCPAGLIGIKDGLVGFAILLGEIKWRVAMPIDSMLVSAAVVTMFAVLAWGERQSRPLQQPADSRRKRRSF